jgi:nucleoside-diphosphate-sugar epimerase
VRALAHSARDESLPTAPNLTWVRGELDDPACLQQLIAPGGCVVHLAFPAGWAPERHLAAAEALASAAVGVGTTRVVHCSTAVVVGGSPPTRIDEHTPCRPVAEYERLKLDIERVLCRVLLSGAVPLVILRPTAVIGPGGWNLRKLARELTAGSRMMSYVRACLQGRRKMNLVCVDNVVEALLFLLNRQHASPCDIFLVSDDDDPMNNYYDVRIALMGHLGVRTSVVPVVPLPPFVASALLRLHGRSCANPMRVFDASKLVEAGYHRTSTLADEVDRFARWFRTGLDAYTEHDSSRHNRYPTNG